MRTALLTILAGALGAGVATAQPTCASLGSGSPTVQDVLNATTNIVTNGCTIGPLTFRFYQYSSVGGAPLASSVSFIATQDPNGVGFTLDFGSSFNAASGFPADAGLKYVAFSTAGTNIIQNLFQSITGTVSGTSYDRLTDFFCTGIIDPAVSCSAGGSETFVTLLSPGGTQTGVATFSPTNEISVNKDMQACSASQGLGVPCGGGVSGPVSITRVQNQFSIVPAPLTLACPASSGTVGVPYSSALVATGGTLPYTFSISAGSLPSPLTLNASTGAITGTPTTAGTFSFTAKVTDSTSGTALTMTSSCSIVIAPAPLTLACPASSGTVGVPYSSALVATGGTLPYAFSISAGSLPPVLTLNASTGAITGTPTTPGTFNFTAKVTDSTSGTALTKTSNCSIVISPVPLQLSCAASIGEVGVPYSSSLTATGGVMPYMFSISVGSLPSGLMLNGSTGAITGTPTTAGGFSFTAKVVDSSGNPATNTVTSPCKITIQPPLMLTCAASAAVVGVPYSSAVTATGGVPPYTFSIATGALPPGLTLNSSTGAITGTPSSPGSFNFSVKVTDSLGAMALSTCSGACSPGTTTWNFSSPAGLLGTSQTYTGNGIVITAYGFTNAGHPTALFGRNSGGDESGLGIHGSIGGDNEIDTANFVQLDLTNVIASGAKTATLLINSVQPGEAYNIYGSNTLGSIGTLLLSNGTADNTAFPMPGFPNYKYLSVRAASKDVLLGAISIPSTGCTITVAPAPTPLKLACPASYGYKDKPYSSALVASGGVSPYMYSIVSGALPGGLTLNKSSGAITGNPAVGDFSFTAQVADFTGKTQSASCTIKISWWWDNNWGGDNDH